MEADLDPEEFIISTRIQCCRSIKGYPLNPCLTKEQYLELEEKVEAVFELWKGGENLFFLVQIAYVTYPEIGGTYYPLEGMTKEVEDKEERMLEQVNACNICPLGAEFTTMRKKHSWFGSMRRITFASYRWKKEKMRVFERLIKGVRAIETKLLFSPPNRKRRILDELVQKWSCTFACIKSAGRAISNNCAAGAVWIFAGCKAKVTRPVMLMHTEVEH
uniref:arginine kinase n=1 Tax=Globodera rostochiensis TaxID=31243 RepID=A0A914I1P0_GLORO